MIRESGFGHHGFSRTCLEVQGQNLFSPAILDEKSALAGES
jgi:hypothetical protein